jgi:hypothetical protein
MALNVVCCETAIRLESEPKRTSLARAQSVADDPTSDMGRPLSYLGLNSHPGHFRRARLTRYHVVSQA